MERAENIRELIDLHRRRLHKLQIQQATYGLSAPPYVALEIEDLQAELERLQTELSKIHGEPGTKAPATVPRGIDNGDFIGDKSYGGTVLGDNITVGNVTNSSGIAIGRGSRATVITGSSGNDAEQLFQAIYAQIKVRDVDPSVEKDEIQEKVQKIEQEAQQGAQINARKLGRWLRELAVMAPDIFDTTVACLMNPTGGFADVVKKVAVEAKAEKP